jgi:hypothetical protein
LRQYNVLLFVVISLNNESRFLDLLLSALVLGFVNEPRVEDAYSIKHLRLVYNLKYSLFQETCNLSLTRSLVLRVILKE